MVELLGVVVLRIRCDLVPVEVTFRVPGEVAMAFGEVELVIAPGVVEPGAIEPGVIELGAIEPEVVEPGVIGLLPGVIDPPGAVLGPAMGDV